MKGEKVEMKFNLLLNEEHFCLYFNSLLEDILYLWKSGTGLEPVQRYVYIQPIPLYPLNK